eukprot:1212230-Amphidinium_carterae.1
MGGYPSPPAQQGSTRLQQLISRTRCNTCGAIGHWSRQCPKKGKGGGGGKPPSSSTTTPSVHFAGDEERSGSSYNNFFMITNDQTQPGASFGSFVGLTTSPQLGVLDTGAQSAVCGVQALARLEQALAQHGLQVVEQELSASDMATKGVGGQAEVVKKVALPLAIAKTSGVVHSLVVASDIPLLLPIHLLHSLGMVLSLPRLQAKWTRIGRSSKVFSEPSGHLTIDILDFARSGWTPPTCHTTVLTSASSMS